MDRAVPRSRRQLEDDEERHAHSRPRWWREVAFVGIVYFLYSLVRNAAPSRVLAAEHNTSVVMAVEHALHLDVEHAVNSFVAGLSAVAVPANYYYATLHFIVTGGVLLWMFAARPRDYRSSRTVLLVMTLLALVGYWLFPLAPPRLTPGEGFVDTVRAFGTWGVSPDTVVASASNQYAAMPSMHVGWALWSGTTLARYARRPVVRALGIAYPFATLFVVIATGNHFVLDAVGALLAFVLGTVAAASLIRMPALSTGTEPVSG